MPSWMSHRGTVPTASLSLGWHCFTAGPLSGGRLYPHPNEASVSSLAVPENSDVAFRRAVYTCL